MPTIVEVNGTEVEFPDGMSVAEISQVLPRLNRYGQFDKGPNRIAQNIESVRRKEPAEPQFLDRNLLNRLREQGVLPAKNQYGQYEIGGPLTGSEGVYEAISPVENLKRALAYGKPKVTPNLMGGADVDIADRYGVALESLGLLGLAPDVTDAARLGLRAARPGLAKAGQGIESLLNAMVEPRSPISNELGAITWHGSPHKFSKFQHKFMGSGEGAQAYGWGTYLAENPDVAKSYSPRDFDFEDRLMAMYKKAESREDYTAMEVLENAMMHESPAEIKARYAGADYDDNFRNAVNSVVDEIEPLYRQSNSNLYEVDLPDEHIEKMLDWDSSLGDQPKEIQEFAAHAFALESGVTPDHPNYKAMVDVIRPQVGAKTGKQLYEAVIQDNLRAAKGDRVLAQQYASEKLNKMGIPGIKYWDGGSRSAGKGTRNYVVFDENLMNIVSRNGEPLSLPTDEASRMARADPALDAALRDYRKAFSEPENIPLTNAKADVYNVLSEEGIMDGDVLMALREGDESLIDEYLEKIGDRRGWAWILEEHQYDDVLEEIDYPEDIFDIARMAKGTTDDLNETGYILPNGDWLDFSGKRHGGPWGQRAEDHRQLGFDMGGESGTDDMILFQKEGAVRIDANAGSADMEIRPTSKQLEDIQYLVERKGEGYIDLADGNRRATIEVISEPNKLKGYIRRFYDGEDIGEVKI